MPPRLLLAGLALALAVMPLLPVPDFWITKLNYIGIFSLVALGLVLLTGVGGLTSFGQAAFAGIGAYTSAYLGTKLGISPWIGLVAGLAITGVVALALGWLTLRMSGHYLPLATIAWSLALFYTMGNLDPLGKYDGLLGVPAIELFGFSFQQERRIYWLIWLAALSAAVAVTHLLDSRPGRVMRSLNHHRGGGVTMPEAMGASTFSAASTRRPSASSSASSTSSWRCWAAWAACGAPSPARHSSSSPKTSCKACSR